MKPKFDSNEFDEKIDREGMLTTLAMAPEHCREALQKTEKIDLSKIFSTINSIVIAGMGGSAIGGILLRDWIIEESRIPIITSQNYTLPGFVDDDTLVIVVSYSGNTEETISAFKDALERGSQVITITSGGQLEKLSLGGDIPCLKLPTEMQPRAALYYQFICLAVLARKLSVLNNIGEDINEAIEILEKMRDELTIDPPDRNIAKMLARDLRGYIPFVYGSHLMKGARARRVGILDVTARGEGKLARILSTLYLGDYISTYLGLLYHVDPSSVNSITAIKQIE